ncbi:MAG: Holliday junction resolvase RuvX, partial [Gammaproteobacteria bacterium]|nr:Holliday junction resolvase RuvX [Gammaproteobacteria bacterium]
MSVNVFIGFDFGTKKIGVAIAQTITNTATPMPAIKMINGQPKWNDLDEIISDFKPKKAIIGIPDSENKQTKKLITKIKIFSSALEKKYTIPTILINEGFSTQ